MKYIYLSLILILVLFNSEHLISQDNLIIKSYNKKYFDFVGTRNNKILYQYYPTLGVTSEECKNFDLYYSILSSNGIINFRLFTTFESNVDYIDEKCMIYRKNSPNKIFMNRNDKEIEIETVGKLNIFEKTHQIEKGDYFYFSTKINEIDFLARINLTQEDLSMEVLPIKGYNPVVYKNWLFYRINYESPKYSGRVDAIYRVKIGDWRNPELIINDVYFGGAVLNENLISCRFFDREKVRDVTYKISDSTYIEKDIAPLIKYEGVYYQHTHYKNPKTGKYQICYKEIPELPETFPYKLIREVDPNQNYLHLPCTEKLFTNSFITDSLLFFAGKEQLERFTNEQLRKLRNAFYAREGYVFKSDDLNNFFKQFEWYEKTIKARKRKGLSNDDIYIPKADKERVELILEIENSK
ncbi:MAG: YARHG domain-containing protein [Bacteroidales bacterium]|nr:YARHG domain-containing protein [Bacteroidales bacterium]